MVVSQRFVKPLAVGIALMIASIAGFVGWCLQDTLNKGLSQVANALVLADTPSPDVSSREVVIRQTIVDNPDPVVSTSPKPVTKPLVKINVLNKPSHPKRLDAFCKYQAYKDLPRCRD